MWFLERQRPPRSRHHHHHHHHRYSATAFLLLIVVVTTLPRGSLPFTSTTTTVTTTTTPSARSSTRFLSSYHGDDEQSSSSSSGNNNNNNNQRRYVSLSSQERRDEEQRRLERKHDVAIGQTSAKLGAKDYLIDPAVTEKNLLLNGFELEEEREIWQKTEEGLQCFKMLQLEQARDAFARVVELKPHAYLYQYGIVLFYLGHVHDAARVFARNAVTFESRFGEPASEERIWRDACELTLTRGTAGLDDGASRVPQIPAPEERDDDDDDGVGVTVERRRVLRLARDLFRASVARDACAVVLARSRLRAVCGSSSTTTTDVRRRPDFKMWKHNAWYFLGLHYDALGKTEESKDCMKMALQQNVGSMNGEDITKCLPVIHMSRRDWYDDDAFEFDSDDSRSKDADDDDTIGTILSWDVEGVIRSGVNDMRTIELQDSLERRGMKTTGLKPVLQERMLDFIMNEAKNGDDPFIT